MVDHRDATSTEDYWVFTPYNLEFRGANDVPARFRARAQWEGHHSAGTGYYTRSTHGNNPIAVEFNHNHLAWVEIRRDRNNNKWTAFRIAADDLQLSIPLSTLTEEELQNILRTPEGEESSEGLEESGESEQPPNLFRDTRPSTPPSSPPQRAISTMNDTPERITIYHGEKVGLLAQRAESLTINEASINATCTQEIPGRTIDPVTGHVPGADPADNLAVFRAFGPDQPDPPPGNGGGGRGGGGGGGGGEGGGGAPPPRPRGAGHEAPLPPHVDNKLYSQSPDIFTGDKRKAREFITQWNLYWSLNFNVAMMRTPFTRAMLFLTFFKGPLTANWTSVMNRHLNTQV